LEKSASSTSTKSERKFFSKVHSNTCNALMAVKTHLPHTQKKISTHIKKKSQERDAQVERETDTG
jgi:hypothetical protein